ncbi:hypothetical protein [Bacillus sp. XF8]|uniref:hypothetical protein n=1 Tax=Bacillus sp. XF8 TaxID=2819289 RepID=UPI001AA00E45|nr:hypothetical protein [Bacillus sp. XF8]MBO1578290.1 hypothetical protein [Bacillus sp. XF8]
MKKTSTDSIFTLYKMKIEFFYIKECDVYDRDRKDILSMMEDERREQDDES